MKAYKSIRHYYWLLTGFVRKHVALLAMSFIGAFLLIIVSLNFFPIINSFLFTKQEIVGVIGSYTPATIPDSIGRQISNPLIVVDQAGEIQPLLANSWEVLNDGTTYRFHLRNDLLWSDGKKFTSKDISYGFADVEIKPIDDYTIEFKLKKQLNIFPIYLTQPVIKAPLVGIGALYRVESFKQNKEQLLSINLAPNKPDLPYKIYKFYKNESDLVNAYKRGDITQFTTPNTAIAEKFTAWNNSKVTRTVDYNKIMAVFFNTQSGPLQDREVRKAFAFATPSFPNKGERAKGPIQPTSWAYNDDVKEYPFNEELAKELIKKNITASEGGTLKMATFYDYIDVAEDIKHSYESVGAKVDLKVAQGVPDEYDFFVAAWSPPTDPDQYFFWHSTQVGTNITKLDNKKVDKLLEDGRKFLNVKQRQSIYKDFQKTIADEIPAYFMYHPFEYVVQRD